MITFKEEFIKRYTEKLCHKITQELEKQIPDKGYFAEMIDEADSIVKEIIKTKGE